MVALVFRDTNLFTAVASVCGVTLEPTRPTPPSVCAPTDRTPPPVCGPPRPPTGPPLRSVGLRWALKPNPFPGSQAEDVHGPPHGGPLRKSPQSTGIPCPAQTRPEDARRSPRTTGLHTLSRCPRGRTGQHNQRRMVVAMAAEGAMGRAHLAPADTVHYPGRTPAPRRPGPHPRVHKSQRPGSRRKKKGEGEGSEPRSVRLPFFAVLSSTRRLKNVPLSMSPCKP